MLNINNIEIQIKFIQNSHRMTIRIINSELIRVTAPAGIKPTQISEFLNLKTDWILKKTEFIKDNKNIIKPINIENGTKIPFCGCNLILQIATGKNHIQKTDSNIVLYVNAKKQYDQKFLKKILIKWLQSEALIQINNRVVYYSNQLAVSPKSVSLKNYISRWGACSSTKALFFNWQIILLDPLFFDYVVAHEVCHLIEMNHSAQFYNLLGQLGFNKNDIHKKMRNMKNIF